MSVHDFLESLTPSTMKFGLDRMFAVDAALGHPWRSYRTLHVAGTNGKGSTCAFSEAIFRAAGLRVGLYTSPHLERVNERIRVDGVDITDAQLQRGVDAVNRAYRGDALTYFEFLTALALWHFREAKVDVGIVEVGLGGRLDGTNVFTPTACAIATIAFDHQAILGNTLEAIAREKAGILKPGVPAAIATRVPEARAAIEAVAREIGAPLKRAGDDFELADGVLRLGERRIEGVRPGLAGAHQQGNAALAAQAALLVEPRLTDAQLRDGLAHPSWPGRLERVGDVLLDGAHNVEGARALAAHLRTLGRPVHLVFGVLGDKDWRDMVDALFPACATVHVVAPESPRALAPADVVEHASRSGDRSHEHVLAQPSLEIALAAARSEASGSNGQVVVAGSLYLVGPAQRLARALGDVPHGP